MSHVPPCKDTSSKGPSRLGVILHFADSFAQRRPFGTRVDDPRADSIVTAQKMASANRRKIARSAHEASNTMVAKRRFKVAETLSANALLAGAR